MNDTSLLTGCRLCCIEDASLCIDCTEDVVKVFKRRVQVAMEGPTLDLAKSGSAKPRAAALTFSCEVCQHEQRATTPTIRQIEVSHNGSP